MDATPPAAPPPSQRAIFFIDGSNFYHRLKEDGVDNPNDLDLRKVAKKLAQARNVVYLLSKDGDMVPGIDIARKKVGKRVFAAGTADCNYAVKHACERYVVLNAEWLKDCYLEDEKKVK